MPKTLVWPAGGDDDAVAQYRLLLPTQALQDQGADVEIDRNGPVIVWNREWKMVPPPDARALGLAERPDCDCIVMQRPARRWWADIIPFLHDFGIRVVVDVDDDFHAIAKGNVAYDSYDPKHGWHNRDWITEACKQADLVTCSTPALLRHYGFGHGMVIPNFVPARYLAVEPIQKREHVAGWTGKLDTHPTDLQVTRGAVGTALSEHAWGFHVLGNADGVQAALRLQAEPSELRWVAFGEYPSRMAEIDLGIVPLDDTRFNRAKSALKVMEFAALGVPVLATATPDNQRMAAEGVGVTVKKPHQWGRAMKRMLESEDYRAEVAASGRERMRQFTYENQAWRWGFAWKLDEDRIRNLGQTAS